MINNYLNQGAFFTIYKKSFWVLGFCCLIFLYTNRGYSQSVSNEGTEFFAVFPMHVSAVLQGGGETKANYSIFITAKQQSRVVVTAGAFNSGTITVNANQVVEVQVPRVDAYLADEGLNTNKAIHIKVLPGQPKVVVYGHIFAGARSAASLILPTEAMGQQYFSMNYDDTFNSRQANGYNFIVIAATEPNTTVLLKRKGVLLNTITLNNIGDVYQYLTTEDPTGLEIVADPVSSACNRFAVFSGSTNMIISGPNCTGESSDPLYQQNYPVESWGTTYGFIPFSSVTPTGVATRTRGSIYRILAKDDATQVKVNGTVVATLNSGEFYPSSYQAVPSTTPSIITANKPIAVAQYALSQSCAGGSGANTVSDPDMVILNPIEYNIKNITVYSSDKEAIGEQYLNVLIKTSAAASFRINGSAPPTSFTTIPSAPEYSYLKLNLNSFGTGNFTLAAQDGFNAIAYGFGDHESYAYSAGTSLSSSQILTAIKKGTQQELFNACTKEDFNFKLILPDKAVKLVWQFDPSEPDLVENNPTATPVVRNNKTVYEYLYPRTRVFDVAGLRNIKVLAEYGSTNICYKEEQEVSFLFEVYDPAKARFSYLDTCALDSTLFTDTSTPATLDKPVTSWLWDFGDGTTSTQQHPKHKFPTSGTFNVSLVVDNGTGCLSDPYTQAVTIRPLPLANFNLSDATCTDNNIVFSDASIASAGTVEEWIWDFGDGTTSTEQNPKHTFPKMGSYTVTLTVKNSFGCISNVYSRNVSVFAPSLDAGPDKTIIRGGQIPLNIKAEGTNLKYKWTPSTGLDDDNVKVPTASPDVETTYTVTITSDEGCVLTDNVKVSIVDDITIPNTFTPNGDGINDLWNISYLESIPTATVNVFTRYGVQVFASKGYVNPWNGSWNGEILMPGTYYYIIRVPFKSKPYSGYVTIIR